MSIQLIDRVNGEEQLREKEGQWAYKLNTLDPHGLNDNDFLFPASAPLTAKPALIRSRPFFFMISCRG